MNDYDKMRKSEVLDDDGLDECDDKTEITDKEKYFDFYDDIKTNIKQDW